MKTIAINGSPRKGWNTHILVEEALKGAASKGSETELVNLYDLNFKGCISCFACKQRGGKSLGRCAAGDDLKPVLDRIHTCDALIIGSPIYISEVTAAVRALFERLTFQYITYSKDRKTFFTRRVPTALIYTMNVSESAIESMGYAEKFKFYEDRFNQIIGPAKTLVSTETWQTTDYSKYEMTMFDGEARKKRRDEIFPQDKQKAFELGAGLI
ncbi:flavodoxin family protein [Treponema primitia]|uniref:flavodoxin family protein n=1 Tax=Treponema primitia TaxID=88058 RepID=UPI0002555354|nr:flavodoxin family protein [Treponema primitia]